MRAKLETIRDIHHIGDDTPEQLVAPNICPRQAEQGMRSAGLSDMGRGYEMGRARPNFIHLLVCTAGEGEIWHDGTYKPCARGDAYLTGINAPHAFRTVGRRRMQAAWMYYRAEAAEVLGLHEGEVRLLHIDPDPIRLLIEGFWRESVGRAQVDMLDRWAELLHLHVLRLCDPRHKPDPLWPLWEQVRSRLAEPWDLARLADQSHLGDEHLRRLCQKLYGHSPMRHLTHLRMQHAATMLLSTPDKIAAVAMRVGYANEFAFSTAFRRWSGKSPGEFRT